MNKLYSSSLALTTTLLLLLVVVIAVLSNDNVQAAAPRTTVKSNRRYPHHHGHHRHSGSPVEHHQRTHPRRRPKKTTTTATATAPAPRDLQPLSDTSACVWRCSNIFSCGWVCPSNRKSLSDSQEEVIQIVKNAPTAPSNFLTPTASATTVSPKLTPMLMRMASMPRAWSDEELVEIHRSEALPFRHFLTRLPPKNVGASYVAPQDAAPTKEVISPLIKRLVKKQELYRW